VTYAAKLSGFYPEDPLEAALADQMVCFMEDVFGVFRPSFGVTDPEEKRKKVAEIAAGPFKEKAGVLSKLLVRAGGWFRLGSPCTLYCLPFDMIDPTLHVLTSVHACLCRRASCM
jgi:hypothetical protein